MDIDLRKKAKKYAVIKYLRFCNTTKRGDTQRYKQITNSSNICSSHFVTNSLK